MSKVLVQRATIRTNSNPGSVCTVTITPVKFADLWSSYPKERHPYQDASGKVPPGFENQCAIKMSATLHGVGLAMKSFKGTTVPLKGKPAAIRAEELAAWLKLQPFCGLPAQPLTITSKDWQQKINGKTGIIFFKDYWARDGEVSHASGDHIDLWNKDRLTPSLSSFVRFTLGLQSIGWLSVSDLGKAKEILFWEVK